MELVSEGSVPLSFRLILVDGVSGEMKVTIIGGSISGLYSAYLLAKEGVSVELYDRVESLGFPPRTLIVTSKLKELLDFSTEEAIVNRVRRFEIFSRSKKITIDLFVPDLVIERERLIKLLARRAEEAGARLILGHQFEGFHREGGKILAKFRNLQTEATFFVHTDILVGADGVWSSVARPFSHNGHYPATLLQAKVAFSGEGGSDTCKVWFDSNFTRYFFWSIPESGGFATVGLIADEDAQASLGLESFLKEKGLRPLEFQKAQVPLHPLSWVSERKVWQGSVFLVGDAASQVKVTTVGGVVAGLYGAKALTRVLLNGGDYDRELRGLNLELDLHLLIRSVLNRFNNRDYDSLLERLNGELKLILQRWNRDELRSFFLRMILTEPQLIGLGLKTFLRSIKERILERKDYSFPDSR